jgi:hypothetical protein
MSQSNIAAMWATTMDTKKRKSTQDSWAYGGGSYDTWSNKTLETFNFDDVKFFDINVHYGDIKATVQYLRG